MKLHKSILPIIAALLCSCNFSNIDATTDQINTEEFSDNSTIHTDIDTEDTYYWFKGEKIILTPCTSKTYLVLSGNKDTQKAATTGRLRNSKFHDVCMAKMNAAKNNLKTQPEEELSWTIVDLSQGQVKQSVTANNIYYSSPLYTTESGSEIGISHLFYVKMADESQISKIEELASKYNVKVIGRDKYLPLWCTLSCSIESHGNTLEIMKLFHDCGEFEAIEPDIMMDLLLDSTISYSYPNDTYATSQWNLFCENSLSTNDFSINHSHLSYYQGKGIKLALIDTGIDGSHPDFDFSSSGGLLSYNLLNFTRDPQDIVFGPHGTACAGIIKAAPNNKEGICGIAPDVTLISYAHPFTLVPNAVQQIANGLEVACSDCDVVNCSWGGEGFNSSMIEDALTFYAYKWGRNGKGTVVVFASGKTGVEGVACPGNINDKNIVVGSIGKNGARSSFSNYGDRLDFVAPGNHIPTTDILSGYFEYQDRYTYNEGHYYTLNFFGTSAACPHVAGVVANMLSANPDLTVDEVRDILISTSVKISTYKFFPNVRIKAVGYGEIHAQNAVKEAYNRRK